MIKLFAAVLIDDSIPAICSAQALRWPAKVLAENNKTKIDMK